MIMVTVSNDNITVASNQNFDDLTEHAVGWCKAINCYSFEHALVHTRNYRPVIALQCE